MKQKPRCSALQVSIHWTDLISHFSISSRLFRKPFTISPMAFFPVAGLDLDFPSHLMIERGWINFHLATGISPFWTIALFTQVIITLHYWKILLFYLEMNGSWFSLNLFSHLLNSHLIVLRLHLFSQAQSGSGAVSLHSTDWSLDGLVPGVWYWEEPSSCIVLCAWCSAGVWPQHAHRYLGQDLVNILSAVI